MGFFTGFAVAVGFGAAAVAEGVPGAGAGEPVGPAPGLVGDCVPGPPASSPARQPVSARAPHTARVSRAVRPRFRLPLRTTRMVVSLIAGRSVAST